MSFLSRFRIVFFFLVAAFVLSGTFLAIKFASGYRFDLDSKSFAPRGLLSATSDPLGAELYVNNKLKGATNTSLFLPPNDYWVEIKKTGFTSWQKRIKIQKELVIKTEATLFLKVPDLRPLTFTGVFDPKISPDGSKIVYSIALPDPQAGLWVLDLTGFIFNINKGPKQIVESRLVGIDLAKTQYVWTDDSRQILLQVDKDTQYLLDPTQLNSPNALVNVIGRLPEMKLSWEKEEKSKLQAKLRKVPQEMVSILMQKAKEVSFSPDDTRISYVATASAEIPEDLIPPVTAASTQTENRNIETNKIYVYDILEDKNFLVPFNGPTPTPAPEKVSALVAHSFLDTSPVWFATSRHLVWLKSTGSEQNAQVEACEYDGTNCNTIYSGPFIFPYVFVAPGENKLIILAKLDNQPETLPNLYSVALK